MNTKDFLLVFLAIVSGATVANLISLKIAADVAKKELANNSQVAGVASVTQTLSNARSLFGP